ncbi:hypothetical protein HB839_01565 [Listeria sp. FSL L7-1699]|uniref:DUF4467 domain-containing protein n=1 Tax=Listeria farberi TaxID=2713500 RepID=A0ABR6SIY3_9LIST|nr:hypothetical protein [Listeria farberi]MBC1374207.1 hypothetical protein [Listeria farberi]MBC1381140.1 hypothetical protein [Listeria farberi]
MKIVKVCLLALSLSVFLVGCGNSESKKYDKKIDLVVEHEDKSLTSTFKKQRNLKREECNFVVYDNKHYVYIEYPAKKDSMKLSRRLCKIDNNNKVSEINLDYMEGLDSDYEEYNIK